MRALRFTAPRSARLVEHDRPTLHDGDALIAPHYVGLCGTDWELFTGSMPYFGQGLASYPLQPGHEVAGVVVESTDSGTPPGSRVMVDPVVGCGECPACHAGRQTHCAQRYELGVRLAMPGGACDLVRVPTRNLHLVPDEVDLRDAALVEPGVTACHAVARFGQAADRRALVIGAGTLGLIAAQLLHSAGAVVDVLDVVPDRKPLIEELAATPVTRVEQARYDLVVEAAGSATAVHDALTAVAPGGQIALIGVQGAPIDHVDVNTLVLNDATLFGVLNGPGLYDVLLARLAEGAVATAPLIDQEYPLADAEHALARLANPARTRPKVLLRVAG